MFYLLGAAVAYSFMIALVFSNVATPFDDVIYDNKDLFLGWPTFLFTFVVPALAVVAGVVDIAEKAFKRRSS